MKNPNLGATIMDFMAILKCIEVAILKCIVQQFPKIF